LLLRAFSEHFSILPQTKCSKKHDNRHSYHHNGISVLPLPQEEKEEKHKKKKEQNRHYGQREETHFKVFGYFFLAQNPAFFYFIAS